MLGISIAGNWRDVPSVAEACESSLGTRIGSVSRPPGNALRPVFRRQRISRAAAARLFLSVQGRNVRDAVQFVDSRKELLEWSSANRKSGIARGLRAPTEPCVFLEGRRTFFFTGGIRHRTDARIANRSRHQKRDEAAVLASNSGQVPIVERQIRGIHQRMIWASTMPATLPKRPGRRA